MKITLSVLLCLAGLIAAPVAAAGEHAHRSKYAGEEQRQIKALSADDVDDLMNGRGWGLAKAAELNGVPGPVHLLELRREMALTSEQIAAIERIRGAMKARAVELGSRLVALERQLDAGFAAGTITDAELRDLLAQLADTGRELRYTHLKTHLMTPSVLTPEQIARYRKLRGYGPGENACAGPGTAQGYRHGRC